MRRSIAPPLAWSLFGLIVAGVAATFVFELVAPPAGGHTAASELLWPLMGLVYALVGTLIMSRRPGNLIGLLLILPGTLAALPVESYLRRFPGPPDDPGALFLTAVWFSGWSWLLLVFPILFLLLLFPTGRPPGPRWRWVGYLGLGMAGAFVLLATFLQEWTNVTNDESWSVRNPIGFISTAWFERDFVGAWFVALPLLTLLCGASLFVRYRRSGAVERTQIRWLLFACALFVAIYVPSFLTNVGDEPVLFFDLLFPVGVLAIPIAIAVAILRHRLYDIDVIIRRTLQYGVLTGILVGLYFGGVLLLQLLLEPLLGGADSPPVVMVTTLGIAALFHPLRVRVQRFLDRRFYRRRVDAERALARFAAIARNEVDLDQLAAALFGVVEETLQPERMTLWLRPEWAGRGRAVAEPP